jgi:hypothetical protein
MLSNIEVSGVFLNENLNERKEMAEGTGVEPA